MAALWLMDRKNFAGRVWNLWFVNSNGNWNQIISDPKTDTARIGPHFDLHNTTTQQFQQQNHSCFFYFLKNKVLFFDGWGVGVVTDFADIVAVTLKCLDQRAERMRWRINRSKYMVQIASKYLGSANLSLFSWPFVFPPFFLTLLKRLLRWPLGSKSWS